MTVFVLDSTTSSIALIIAMSGCGAQSGHSSVDSRVARQQRAIMPSAKIGWNCRNLPALPSRQRAGR
jgi:uncharacterized protein YceK